MSLIGILTSVGLSQSVAKKVAPWAVGGAIVAVALVSFLIWNHFDNKDAIERDRIKREAVEAQQALERERDANTAGRGRDAARDAAADQTETRLEEIDNEDPEAARAAAPAGSRAVADRLRGDDGG